MNYRIKSGHITVSRRFFGKESLRPGSYLRYLIGLEGRWSKKVSDIEREGDTVHITYQRDDTVYMEDDFRSFIRRMKDEYKDEIHGRITVAKLRGMVDFLDLTIDF